MIFLSVCDNCTLTLLDRTDELTEILNEGANHINLGDVPAPWPRLVNFENESVLLGQRLDDFLEIQAYIEEFDDDAIEKVKDFRALLANFILPQNFSFHRAASVQSDQSQ